MTGTIKRLATDRQTGESKGYGFIKAGSIEYFFHRSAVLRSGGYAGLSEGQSVEFDPEDGEKGPRAVNVR